MAKKKGRRCKYEGWLTQEGLVKIQGWARDGLNNEQIAHNMGIAVATLYEWQDKYKDFSEALKKGKEVVDREVENSLLKSARGYYYEEETIVELPDGRQETRKVKRYAQPNTTAQIFWLKNRRPNDWRDKREVEMSGSLGISDAISKARERMKHGETE
jgi:transposase